MKTAEAISKLRERMGLTQQQFAEFLGIATNSVGRYERGREPSRAVLFRLAEVSRGVGITYLADFFSVKRRAGLLATIDNLRSTGSARRIAVSELKAWAGIQEAIFQGLKGILDGTIDPKSEDGRTLLAHMLAWNAATAAELNQYIDPPKRVSWDELTPATQAAMLAPRDPEKEKAAIQDMQRINEKFWGRASAAPQPEPENSTKRDSAPSPREQTTPAQEEPRAQKRKGRSKSPHSPRPKNRKT